MTISCNSPMCIKFNKRAKAMRISFEPSPKKRSLPRPKTVKPQSQKS